MKKLLFLLLSAPLTSILLPLPVFAQMTMPPPDVCPGAPNVTVIPAGATQSFSGGNYGCVSVNGTLNLSGTVTVTRFHGHPGSVVRMNSGRLQTANVALSGEQSAAPPPPPPSSNPVHCVVSAWSAWSTWSTSVSISESQEQRSSHALAHGRDAPSNGGAACPALTETDAETRSITGVAAPPAMGDSSSPQASVTDGQGVVWALNASKQTTRNGAVYAAAAASYASWSIRDRSTR